MQISHASFVINDIIYDFVTKFKLILEALVDLSQILALTKITRYTVLHVSDLPLKVSICAIQTFKWRSEHTSLLILHLLVGL